MISLKQAKREAEKLTADKDYIRIPKPTTLNDWRYKEVFPKPVKMKEMGKAGGRVGLYIDELPILLATAADLKDSNTDYLIEIAQFRKALQPKLNKIPPTPEGTHKIRELLREKDEKLKEVIHEELIHAGLEGELKDGGEEGQQFKQVAGELRYLMKYQRYHNNYFRKQDNYMEAKKGRN